MCLSYEHSDKTLKNKLSTTDRERVKWVQYLHQMRLLTQIHHVLYSLSLWSYDWAWNCNVYCKSSLKHRMSWTPHNELGWFLNGSKPLNTCQRASSLLINHWKLDSSTEMYKMHEYCKMDPRTGIILTPTITLPNIFWGIKSYLVYLLVYTYMTQGSWVR